MIRDSHGHELHDLTHNEEMHLIAAHPHANIVLPVLGVAALVGIGFAVKGCQTAPVAVPAHANSHSSVRFERVAPQATLAASGAYVAYVK